MTTYLIYGANGYTGQLIAREAVRRGHQPILAGRNAMDVAALAGELNLPHRIFDLTNTQAMHEVLRETPVVLHCAGPFLHTSEPMLEACLQTGTHYLDITGEIDVLERCASRNEEAQKANAMVMPGAGFDVVPTDCVAAHLKSRLPDATHLALGFHSKSPGGVSRGTATTMVERMDGGGMIRRDGRLTRVPVAWKTRTIDFGEGPRKAITIPWGDVSTAYHSTGIPNTEVYVAVPRRLRVAARMSRYFGWLLRRKWLKSWMKNRIRNRPPGPTDAEREQGSTLVWGEATDAKGEKAVTRLRGPDGYTFTVLTALAVVERVLAGDAPVGFQTPSKAYGADWVMELEGVERGGRGVSKSGDISPPL